MSKTWNNNKKESAVAHYKIIDGKRFLKIDNEFVEVELIKTTKGYLKVEPIENKNQQKLL